MASGRARQLWEGGVALRDAWLAFATEADRHALRDIPSAIDAASSHGGQASADKLTALLGRLNAGLAASRQRQEMHHHLKEQLLTAILNDDLIALGYREQPSISTAPVAIHASHFEEGEADWSQSRFDANGLVWNRVRIAEPTRSPITSKPSSADLIRRAIIALCANDEQFCDKSRKLQAHLVRCKIGVAPKRGNGLSDENIAKLIVKICGLRSISNSTE